MARIKASKRNPLLRTHTNFPEECAHVNFFGCKNAAQCLGCFYNPIKQEALANRPGFEEDKKTATQNWFYGQPKKELEKQLKTLDDIKAGRGLRKGGLRCKWRYARKNDIDD